jgi:hypothetical protein
MIHWAEEKYKTEAQSALNRYQLKLNPCIPLLAIDKFYHAHKRWSNNGDLSHVRHQNSLKLSPEMQWSSYFNMDWQFYGIALG